MSTGWDLLLRGGFVMPGDAPGYPADVAIQGSRIAAVGPRLPVGAAATVLDATGCWVCPGFIDCHAHSALRALTDPHLTPKIAQGFTTEVIHPDGLAPAPVRPDSLDARRTYLAGLEGPGPAAWPWSTLGEFLDTLAAARPATTLVAAIGHNALRDYVMGLDDRSPSADELATMRRVLRESADAGARVFSLGLIYLPGMYAPTEELVALAEEAARADIPLMPHVRNEGDQVLDAVGEMIAVARQAGARLHLSHLKVVGRPELVEPLLALLDRARRDVDLSFDQYPYGAGSTLASALLPPWALVGGPTATLERLADPATAASIRRDLEQGLPGWENLFRACGPDKIVIVDTGPTHREWVGQTLEAIASTLRISSAEAVVHVLRATRLAATMVDHYASESTVRTIFQHDLALVGTDGIFSAHPHPRLYGTAARVLGRYAIRERLISPEAAIARLTAKAADRFRLTDRGRIRPGLRADLVVLDPTAYVDAATYENPTVAPTGVRFVVVGGQVAWQNGVSTDQRAGGVYGR